MEIWKDINGYVGYYQISNLGNVKSIEKTIFKKTPLNQKTKTKYTYKERILKNKYDKDGYCMIMLSKKGKIKNHRIHRLVAMAFLENKTDCKIVNHKNEIKTDNNVLNLEWCTVKYNTNYGNGILKRAKTQGKPVIYETETEKKEYYSIGNAAKCTNTVPSTIYRYVNNIGNSVNNKYWKYA